MTMLWGDSIGREFKTLQAAYFADAPVREKKVGLKVSTWPATGASLALPGVAFAASVTGASTGTFAQHPPKVKGSGKLTRGRVPVSAAPAGPTANLPSIAPAKPRLPAAAEDDSAVVVPQQPSTAPAASGSRRGGGKQPNRWIRKKKYEGSVWDASATPGGTRPNTTATVGDVSTDTWLGADAAPQFQPTSTASPWHKSNAPAPPKAEDIEDRVVVLPPQPTGGSRRHVPASPPPSQSPPRSRAAASRGNPLNMTVGSMDSRGMGEKPDGGDGTEEPLGRPPALLVELERMMTAVEVATSRGTQAEDEKVWARVQGHCNVLEVFAQHFRQYQGVLHGVVDSVRRAMHEQFLRQETLAEHMTKPPVPWPPPAPPAPPPPPQLKHRVSELEAKLAESERRRADEVAAVHSLFSREVDDLQAQLAVPCALCSAREVACDTDTPAVAALQDSAYDGTPETKLTDTAETAALDEVTTDEDGRTWFPPKGMGEDVPVYLRSALPVERVPMGEDEVIEHVLGFFMLLEEPEADGSNELLHKDPAEVYTEYLHTGRSPEAALRLAYTIDAARAAHPDTEDFLILSHVLDPNAALLTSSSLTPPASPLQRARAASQVGPPESPAHQ